MYAREGDSRDKDGKQGSSRVELREIIEGEHTH